MKFSAIIIFLFFNSQFSFGQIGMNLRYNFTNYTDEEKLENGRKGGNFEFGINYNWQLKNIRISLLPNIFYGTSTDHKVTTLNNGVAFDQKYVGLRLESRLYLFDLKNDCDCPTFKKEGNFVKKGFFVSISPGFSLHIFEIMEENQSELIGNVSLGIGLDIGLNRIITLTPSFGYSTNLVSQTDSILRAKDIIRKNTLHCGIRIGFHLQN